MYEAGLGEELLLVVLTATDIVTSNVYLGLPG